MDLQKQIDEILELYTQQQLAELLGISQWKLLEKMRDNNFLRKEELLIMNTRCNLINNRNISFLEIYEHYNPQIFVKDDIVVIKNGIEIHYGNYYTFFIYNAT